MSLGNLVKIPSGPNWKTSEEASWWLKGGGLRYLQTVEGGHEIGVTGVLGAQKSQFPPLCFIIFLSPNSHQKWWGKQGLLPLKRILSRLNMEVLLCSDFYFPLRRHAINVLCCLLPLPQLPFPVLAG